MLSAEENRVLTSTAHDTPMGRVLRRYWLPAAMSAELVADGDPLKVELLGEKLVAFRDSDGRVGVMDEHCPHRGASLSLGINADCGLRCLYHGWKMAADGTILETPSEPEDSTFKERIRHVSYPVCERGGFVWAFLGEAGTETELPDFEWMDLDPDRIGIQKIVQECNWVQAVEGVIDSAHIGYLHSSTYGAPEGVDIPGVAASAGGFAALTADGRPRLEAENTSYGFRYAAIRRPRSGEGSQHLRISHFVAPFYGVFPGNDVYDDDHGNLQIFVPVNDVETMQYYVVYDRGKPLEDHVRQWIEDQNRELGIDRDYRRAARRENGWLQDREAIRRGESGSGLGTIANEDMSVQESMGAIYDRTRERLGTSDIAVIRMRRIMLAAARSLADTGAEPPGTAFDGTLKRARSVDLLAAAEEPWQSFAVAAGAGAPGA